MAESITEQKNGKGNKRGMHPNSRNNLKPHWVKGASGNPKGAPPKIVCLTSWLKEYAEKLISEPIDTKKLTYAQAAALSAWKAAAKGDLSEYNFIIDRIEGKVAQPITGEGGGPVKVEIDVKDKLLSELNRLSARAGQESDNKQS